MSNKLKFARLLKIINLFASKANLNKLFILFVLTAFICINSYPLVAQNRTIPKTQSYNLNSLEQSKKLYQNGEYSEAIAILQQTVRKREKQGDALGSAIALSNLALIYRQLGELHKAQQSINKSLAIFKNSNTKDVGTFANILNIKGSVELDFGQTEEALNIWQQSEKLYRQLDNKNGVFTSRINQAQAWQNLGFYRRSLNLLTQLNEELELEKNSLIKAVQLRSLGNALKLAGDLQQSRQILTESKTIAEELRSPADISAALFSLGNTARIERNYNDAIAFYEEAANIFPNSTIEIQSQINQLSLLVETEEIIDARELLPKIQIQLTSLPPSQSSIYAKLHLADILWQLNTETDAIVSLCHNAIAESKKMGDRRAESLALGTLGNIYEKNKRFKDAEIYTQQALTIAKVINAADITYRWHWQLGRLLKIKEDISGAISAYDGAVQNLQSLRSDLAAVNQNLQYSFKESVEPVYRESVALLLESQQQNPDEEILNKARNRIEALQLAELDDYFREACIDTTTVLVDNVVDRDNPTTAIIYPIILPQQLQVIVKIPQQPLRYYRVDKSQTEVESTLQQIREYALEPDRTEDVRLLSQQVYNWLIKDIESDLSAKKVDTLVFVLDGALRNVPMSMLYDGEQYLVEKYAVALSLGLQLFPPSALAKQSLQVLAAGLVQPPPEFSQFPSLPDIKSEFDLIEQSGVTNKQLLNEEFTKDTLERNVNTIPFNILHLATHGQFSSNPEDTFILAADGAIDITQFDRLLRRRGETRDRSLELLILSACQTAVGDNRAILGLAGTSVKAGARSTLASLWNISDRGTAILMGEFYRELAQNKVTKAEALRRAQVILLEKYPDYARPGFWAPYVLVGNWL